MPIPIIATGLREGISAIPHVWTFLRIAPWVLALVALKYYFEGASNRSERMMRSKVIMVTVSLPHQPHLTQTNKLGRHFGHRRRSSPRTSNARRPSNPPNPPTTIGHLPIRTHRRSAQKHRKPPHLRRTSRPHIPTLNPHLRNKMDRQHPTPQTRLYNSSREHNRTLNPPSNNRRHRPRMANKLPIQLPPPQHPVSSAASTAGSPRRARDFRLLLQLYRWELWES